MIAPRKKSMPAKAASIYQIKVELMYAKPAIWRRLQVPGAAKLGWLHAALQVAMGWTNSHLHHFLAGEQCYSDPQVELDSPFGDASDLDENKAVLDQVMPGEGCQIIYEYDFGDSWMHHVLVEKIFPAVNPPTPKAVCLAGARACPPEDCGSVPGYTNLLRIMKKPKHKEYESYLEWLGGPFDPNKFDVGLTNRCLEMLRWPRTSATQLAKVLLFRDLQD